MKFSAPLLDEIRARLPVSAVVGRRVQLKKQGREWRGLSPFNAEKTPSFYVNDQKGFYHCFSSGRHGDIFRFVMETDGLSFPEAVERLAADAGVALPDPTPEDIERDKRRLTLHETMELASRYFMATLQSREGALARGYLSDRGLTPAIQADFQLGFAPESKHGLRDHLAAKGIDRETMIEAGLLIHGEDVTVPYDRFRGRIIFPIHDVKGRVIAFGGRAMDPGAQAKYLNSPETPLFHKGACLYNHHRARSAAHDKGMVIAVEGYVDVIMMSIAGFQNTVAPLGTALTEDQLELLWRMSEEPMLCFDGDKAGRRAAYRAVETALPHIGPSRSLRFALLPEGQDPDDLVRSSGAGAIDSVLRGALPLADMLWARETETRDISTPERRAALERSLADALQPIRDEAVRKHYRAAMDLRLKALFGDSAKPARGFDRKRNERLGGAGPATSSVKEGGLVRGGRSVAPRREALIVAAVISHPFLLDHHCEALSELEFDNSEVARLSAALVDGAAQGLHDSAALLAFLEEKGLARAAERLKLAVLPLHWWLDSAAAPADVEQVFVHVLHLHRKMRTLHKELRRAVAALELDLTEENLATLAAIKAQIATTEGAEAAIEGFGALSGRQASRV